MRVEPPWGAGHGAPWRRTRGIEKGHCPAWPPGTVAGLRGSWGAEEGWGGVSPGVRKVLGGHQEGPPAGQRLPGGKGCGCVRTGLHRAGAGGRLPRTWGALPSPLGDTVPASSAPGLAPRRLELCKASWEPGWVRPGRRGGQKGAPQSRRAVGLTHQPGVAWAPRPTGLVPTQPPLSRCLGLSQGPGRLGGLPPPTSAPSAAPPAGSPTSSLEAQGFGALATGLV